jgi:hypothetical protein
MLVDAYTQWRDDGKPFEVVLVTSGITDEGLFEYMTDSGMPWLALSPSSDKVLSLVQRYGIQWVPTLIIIDSDGNTLSFTGREDVAERGAAAYDTWVGASAGG